MSNGLTGWSCIYCGCPLDGPDDGERHQESGECSGRLIEVDHLGEGYPQDTPLRPLEPRQMPTSEQQEAHRKAHPDPTRERGPRPVK